ncbi:MAG: hypothetical protein EOO68_01900, partial [Moraxellaceae bacterium]
MSNAAADDQIENKIIYSIFQKRPKRADIYWFVHVDNGAIKISLFRRVLFKYSTNSGGCFSHCLCGTVLTVVVMWLRILCPMKEL